MSGSEDTLEKKKSITQDKRREGNPTDHGPNAIQESVLKKDLSDKVIFEWRFE